MTQVSRPQRRAAVLIAGHAIDDLYQGAVPALVPFMVADRHYGYLAASGITLAATLLSSAAQPLFGLLTDRRPLPWLVPAGMILAASASRHRACPPATCSPGSRSRCPASASRPTTPNRRDWPAPQPAAATSG